ncbi:TonB-dependent receptor [Sphingomonas nostoxanthinifaciens]|nr:TonB-dependent receptor [Sphingomonas nostoxanthinifaciens]
MSLAIGLVFAAPAFAQDAPASTLPGDAAGGAPTAGGEIVVTGSRIARRDLDTPAPLAVVSDAEFKQSGQVNVEQVLNALPQVIPGSTAFSNNPGGGVSTLNLRGLKSQRTLVLVDGKRWMSYDTSQTVDLNTIPQFLLQGVDVVTGGASAVYGSDAIAGVVNFRLKNNLQGVEVGAQYNLTGEGDGPRFDAHAALGTEFAEGKGHITIYGEYYKRNPIFQNERDYTRLALLENATKTGLVGGGSGFVPAGRFVALGDASLSAGTNFASGTSGAIFPTVGGTSRPYVSTDAYNYAPSNYLMVPQERWLMGGYGEYEIDSHATAYMQVSFVNNRVDASLAASPFGGNYVYNLANEGKYLSAADLATLTAIGNAQAAVVNADKSVGLKVTSASGTTYTITPGLVALSTNRRTLEVGLRQNHDDRNAYRILGGLKGDIALGWTYDASYMYSRTRNAEVQSGNLSQRAIQAGLLDGSLDLFGAGSLTPAMASQIAIQAQNGDISTLEVANITTQGKLFNFGWGADDVALVVGGEWRAMHSQFIPDTALASGDVVGFNAAKPTAGGYNVKEVFSELSVPVIAHKPFIERLEFDARARYSKYSLGAVGGVWTYAFGAEYAPIKDITFRGQYSKAIRAPNVGELYGGAGQDSAQASDPCAVASAKSNATLNALCIATGVPAANVGTGIALAPNAQIGGITGGNPNLQQENSTSYTYGAVIRPHWIPRLNFTADYFNIDVKNAIAAGGGGVANILNLCYNVIQSASSPICQLIHRNPSTGVIDGSTGANGQQYAVFETQANLGFYKTTGVDIGADYTQPLNWGIGVSQSRLNARVLATWTQHFDIQAIAGLQTVHCAGHFGLTCGDPQPHWKINSQLTWQNGPVTLNGRWEHLGEAYNDSSTVFFVNRLKSYDKFDVTVTADLTDHFQVSAGVNNVANKTPQLLGGNQQQSNTYPGTYDVLGRDFFVSASARF